MQAPLEERLKQMQDMGMVLGNMKTQRVYIYAEDALTEDQEKELTEMGVSIHMDTWIPPVGNHHYGFFIAEIPIDKIEVLAARDYIVKLDTAERQGQTQCQINDDQ